MNPLSKLREHSEKTLSVNESITHLWRKIKRDVRRNTVKNKTLGYMFYKKASLDKATINITSEENRIIILIENLIDFYKCN